MREKMKSIRPPRMLPPAKAATGIVGFDEITGGGLPHGRTSVVTGGPGSGKTIFSLQFLTHGALNCKEPGIFVAFEEPTARIVANAESLGWKLADLRRKDLFFMDAQLDPDVIQSGDFDLGGLLAALAVKIPAVKARRVVFDALNVMLAMLPDAAARRRELYRLHEWLLARNVTGIITLQASTDATGSIGQQHFEYMQFMVDCAVTLNHCVVQGVSQRNLRVVKYRGSGFDEDESPFLIGKHGLEVAVARTRIRADTRVSNERVSTGVTRLDTMLDGGYYRGASVLVTGSPGTAKTTLSGAFTEAACERGEHTLFISFDSEYAELIRNLASVGIRLDRFVKNGLLRIIPARDITGSAEIYLARIKELATEHKARCLVIDPVSTWSQSGNDLTAQSVAERLVDWSKAEGITMVRTRLLDEMFCPSERSASMQISSLSDTWIHLNYLVQAGERNRGLSIIKSRGTAHSNQVRELILSATGVTLTDAYTASGEVLMGTQRWEKEHAERVATEAAKAAAKLKRVSLDAEETELVARLKSLQTEIVAKQLEKALLVSTTERLEGEVSRGRTRMQELRGADVPVTTRK
jgi:circadian clock protein KaiC